MTHREFINIQDNILELKGHILAKKLGVPASSVSNWRKPPEEGGRPVPDYIAILMGHLQALHFGTVQIPLSIDEIMELSTLATQRGLGFGDYILTLIREQLPRLADVLIESGNKSITTYDYADATAAQHAEAFLRTISTQPVPSVPSVP